MSDRSRNVAAGILGFATLLVAATLMLTCAMAVKLGVEQGLSVKCMAAEGTSMEPGMRSGDMLVLEAPEDLKPRDVVVFRSYPDPDKLICHRLVEYTLAEGTGWITQGDNNTRIDGYVTPESNVIGRVAFIAPNFGWFARLGTEHVILCGIITVLAGCLVGFGWAMLAGKLVIAERKGV